MRVQCEFSLSARKRSSLCAGNAVRRLRDVKKPRSRPRRGVSRGPEACDALARVTAVKLSCLLSLSPPFDFPEILVLFRKNFNSLLPLENRGVEIACWPIAWLEVPYRVGRIWGLGGLEAQRKAFRKARLRKKPRERKGRGRARAREREGHAHTHTDRDALTESSSAG